MKGLCAECGQDLTQLQSKNGEQQVPLSTATVSMVHSVPELMVSSEQAEKLGREDQQRLHRNRKLVLMVDLDQTLIHTTEQHCPQMSNKGIFHFQLGRGEPMLHTRLRPHCKDFLEKIAKLYELHVFTFGSRLYAHTIAGFLDPEKKLFSHRILSRDECIDPFSKTGNLRNLFPCGDSMVCIIDDREDVWKFAPNLITVKKYVYFPGTGDVNAPPGHRESQARKKVNHSSKGADVLEPAPSVKELEEGRPVAGAERSNGLGKPTREVNGSEAALGASPSKADERDTWPCPRAPGGRELAEAPEPQAQASCEQGGRTSPGAQPTQGASSPELDFDLSSDSESSESEGPKSSSSTSEGESERRSRKKPAAARDGVKAAQQGGPPDTGGERLAGAGPPGEPGPRVHTQDKGPDLDGQEEGERDGLCGLGNGCVDRKEAETESQNSEQSGITAGESLDQSMEEEEEEDTDEDDHLIHLEEILVRVHRDYYSRYDRYLNQELTEAPDIRKIVPELKSKVLADVAVIFSGLHPTNFPVEKTREHYHATALGARVLTQLVLSPDAPDRATHLIAARAGTEKVRQAQECRHLHVVSPDWLWSCLERWDKVEEQLFPLTEDDARAHSTQGLLLHTLHQGTQPGARGFGNHVPGQWTLVVLHAVPPGRTALQPFLTGTACFQQPCSTPRPSTPRPSLAPRSGSMTPTQGNLSGQVPRALHQHPPAPCLSTGSRPPSEPSSHSSRRCLVKSCLTCGTENGPALLGGSGSPACRRPCRCTHCAGRTWRAWTRRWMTSSGKAVTTATVRRGGQRNRMRTGRVQHGPGSPRPPAPRGAHRWDQPRPATGALRAPAVPEATRES
ncbi:RNA polymerase II subunit A C-terminal domain phosphatase isoform X3 [Marmota monax]|uniref:RNA polymerase II subunit A C-terminal domain phosphatase isoform X3 n=1 Tax=Marmota monax TaxID=9995 RepID=UPI001EB00233|nr:RNA polymerase II subunit A C-terminal domain phosphatase isoform X3 [Marmota monax]